MTSINRLYLSTMNTPTMIDFPKTSPRRGMSLLLALGISITATVSSQAQISKVPGYISYQGNVLDNTGALVGATAPVNRKVIFRIWDHPSNAAISNLIYSEEQTVTISNGAFSVLVGQGVATVGSQYGYSESGKGLPTVSIADAFNGRERYLGVTVEDGSPAVDNEVSPRQQIVSSAFAFRAKEAESLTAGTLAGAITASGATFTGGSFSGGTFSSGTFSGTGTNLTALTASNISLGTLSDARLSSNVALINRNGQTFTRNNNFTGNVGIGTTVAKAPLHVAGDYYGKGHMYLYSTAGDGLSGAAYVQARDKSNSSSIALQLRTQKSGAVVESMTLTPEGNVGIGTNVPTKAKLVVEGGPVRNINGGVFGYLDKDNLRLNYTDSTTFRAGIANISWPNTNLSIYADKGIQGEFFLAHSDARIKNVIGLSDGAKDLDTLQAIEITDYGYKDVIAEGPARQKKVVAQQVEQVFPLAVSKSTGVVPDIYLQATVEKGWIVLATDLKQGERVRLISEDGKEEVHEVLEVEQGRFRTDSKQEGDRIFVYGREVKDFLSVDYDAIAMLNVSATQQIKKEKDEEVKALMEEVAILRRQLADRDKRVADLEIRDKARGLRVSALEARDAARDAKLTAIEKRLGLDQPVVRTVSVVSGGVTE